MAQWARQSHRRHDTCIEARPVIFRLRQNWMRLAKLAGDGQDWRRESGQVELPSRMPTP